MLRVENLSYWYQNEADYLFKDVNFSFEPGKTYAILGTSGSGKTTFLSLLAGLDKPKKGTILYKDEDIQKIGLTSYRKHGVSIVFQAYNLLTYMTAVQNVVTAMEITGSNEQNKQALAIKKLGEVGINEELANKPVNLLSGGQQQRVAIVRAMCCDGQVIVADEPTGNLDQETTQEIVSIFEQIAKEENKVVIIVTHEQEVAEKCDVVITLKDKVFHVS